MHFDCIHCGKTILCAPRVIDGGLIHRSCEDDFNRAKIIQKWEDSGLLDGLTAMSPEKSKKIEELYGCCKGPFNLSELK